MWNLQMIQFLNKIQLQEHTFVTEDIIFTNLQVISMSS